jgi:hypothetical protein
MHDFKKYFKFQYVWNEKKEGKRSLLPKWEQMGM